MSFNWRRVECLSRALACAFGLASLVYGVVHFEPLMVLLGLGAAGTLCALLGVGRNPRPQSGLGATAQARSYQLELVEQDEEAQIRCVVTEFMRRPLTEESIATLESDIELTLRRSEQEFSNVLAGGGKTREQVLREAVLDLVQTGGLPPPEKSAARRIDASIEDAMPGPLAPAERPDSPWDDPLHLGREIPKWSCKRDGHIFEEGNCRCVVCKVELQREVTDDPEADDRGLRGGGRWE